MVKSRKRGNGHAQVAATPGSRVHGSQVRSPGAQEDASGDKKQAPASDTRADVLQGVRKSMGAASKEPLLLLRMMCMDLLSPCHVQAFLEALDGLDGALPPRVCTA